MNECGRNTEFNTIYKLSIRAVLRFKKPYRMSLSKHR